MKKKNNKSGFVYSTDPDFKIPESEDADNGRIPPQQQNLRIWLEKNHRGGKDVSIIKNFVGPVDEMEELCRELKTKCGTGGSVKHGDILIQGDQRKKIGEILASLGYKFKLAGG